MAVGIETIIASAALSGMGNNARDALRPAVSNMGEGGIQRAIRAIRNLWTKGAGNTLVTHGQALRIEPILLLDERVARLPYVRSIVDANQRLYTSYLLMAIAVDNVIGTAVGKRIDKYSPDRDLQHATASFLDSLESYQFGGLPFVGEPLGFDRYGQFSPESAHPHVTPSTESDEVSKGMDLAKMASEISNLSMGQLINVEIIEGGQRGIIPLNVRVHVLGASPTNIISALGYGMGEGTKSDRRRKYRVGEISRKELCTQQDRIDEYRRARFSDKSGYFKNVIKRSNKGLLATLLTGEPSIGVISSMGVISSTTRAELEDKHLGNLNDYARRQQLFQQTLLAQLMVVDDGAGSVTIYTRDYEDGRDYTLKDLEQSFKNNSTSDLAELMKSFMNGQIPGRL